MGMNLDMDPELREMIAERAAEKIAALAMPNPEDFHDPLVDKKAAARFLNCSTKYIDQHWLQQPGFPYHQDKGPQLQFRLGELDRYLDTHQLYA